MTYKAPGKYYRKGISIMELMEMFPDDATAEKWFVETRWGDDMRCAHCDSDNVTIRGNHPKMPYRCKSCRKFFSVKTGTVLQSSKLGYQKWAICMYMFICNLKGVSAMKVHRELKISYNAAWHMLHRLREALETGDPIFAGPVEVDEIYLGGRDTNKHRNKVKPGRGVANKLAVAGILDRATNQIDTKVVPNTEKPTLQSFVTDRTQKDAVVYSDEYRSYVGIDRPHKTVAHGTGEYVRGNVHSNSLESHWAMMRRGIMGTFHHISDKHTHRYAAEFKGRHNIRPMDTKGQMQSVARGTVGKRLRFKDLIAN